MRGKAFLIAMVCAVVVISALVLSKRIAGKREVSTEITQPATPATGSASTQGPQSTGSVEREPATVSVDGRPKGKGKPSQAADPQFQQWISDEAKSVDQPRVDSDAKEVEIKRMASKLTKAQSTQLLQTASSATAPPGEKILSTYMMVQGGLNTREELRSFITAPLKENGPHEPHSEGEINGIREKSLRIMAIDGLFSQAKSDPQAKAALASAVVDSEDPYIKRYAQDKLNQLERP